MAIAAGAKKQFGHPSGLCANKQEATATFAGSFGASLSSPTALLSLNAPCARFGF